MSAIKLPTSVTIHYTLHDVLFKKKEWRRMNKRIKIRWSSKDLKFKLTMYVYTCVSSSLVLQHILDEKCTDSLCTHQTENSDNFQKSGGLTPARRVEKNEGFGRSERVADESVEVEAFTKHPHIGRTLEIQAQEGKKLTIHLQEPVSRLSVKRFFSYRSS